ncbi:hypothetical protein P261_00521 [Lachnospiraceae bacterium TWA4]|nr:hypothetical protein P261_00521 [Lachnospiraceae bacterium TWA4]
MMFNECQGKPKVEILEKTCPKCGEPIEIVSTDADATCDNCGQVIYNDLLSCVQWCDEAKECVGEEVYNKLMKAIERDLINPDEFED